MTAPLNESIAKELRGFSRNENEAAWKIIQSELDSLGSKIYTRRPALWFRTYGIGAPSYADLLFIDATHNNAITRLYGFRRALALIAKNAHTAGDDREVGRAILLLSHHAISRQAGKNRINAQKSRKHSGKPTDNEIRQQARRFLKMPGHHPRNLVAHLEAFFAGKNKGISGRTLRQRLKKLGI